MSVWIYQILMTLYALAIKIHSLKSSKSKLLVVGHKKTLALFEGNPIFKKDDFVVWIHAASLGEFEQGRPIIEKIKSERPEAKILLTFFSPSGYEIRKNYPLADYCCYLPLDCPKNALKFTEFFKPNLAIIVKYEFWYFYFQELKNKGIPLFSVSCIFRENQHFFTKNWQLNKMLDAVNHFYCQNEESKKLLQSIDYQNVTTSGDTRFDRVWQNHLTEKKLDFLPDIDLAKITIVVGSAWIEDIKILKKSIHFFNDCIWIIAPHEVDSGHCQAIISELNLPSSLLSEKHEKSHNKVLIVDSIGKLNEIYSIAQVAFVGGAFGKGLHNILEPAVFGVPVIFGPKYEKFQEAKDLITLQGAISVSNEEETFQTLKSILENEKLRLKMGEINKNYIQEKIGATDIIWNGIKSHFPI